MNVIIGSGAAAIAGAKTMRSLSPADEITIISADSFPYSRPMLHKYLSNEKDFNGIRTVADNFFTEMNIRNIQGATVTGVRANEKKIFYDGKELSYDKLLIATGANAVVPPIGKLAEGKNVFCLRHFSDAKAIKEKAANIKKAIVLGGGLVGLDAACALLELGKEVCVIEMAGRVLALNLDEAAAKAYQDRFEAAGCEFILNAKAVDTIMDDSTGNISALKLEGGEVINCDMLVVAAGVRPAASFLEGSGIEVGRGIIVDKYLKTSADDVYAAGDVTGLSGIWPNAVSLGEAAAKNMYGQGIEYSTVLTQKNNIYYYRLPSLSIGTIQPVENDEVIVKRDNEKYYRLITEKGIVKGVILQGDISKSELWQYLIKSGKDISAIKKPVWELSLADFS